MSTPDVATPNRFQHLDRILTRSGPFVDPDSFNPGANTQKFLREECKVLVIGQCSPTKCSQRIVAHGALPYRCWWAGMRDLGESCFNGLQ